MSNPYSRTEARSRLTSSPFAFAGFMELLERRGFEIGVDQHMRLQGVLRGFGPHSAPKTLKFILCPLFAADRKQQERFYALFDEYFNTADSEDEPPAPEPAAKPPESVEPVREAGKCIYFAAGLLWLIFAGLLAYHFAHKTEISDPKTRAEETVIPESEIPRRLDLTLTIPLKAGPPPELTFYQRYGGLIRATAPAVPLIVCVLYLLYRSGRRKTAIQKGKGGPPPYYLPIRVEWARPDFLAHRAFYDAANRLRERIESEMTRLDYARTISATIEQAGFPSFLYRAVTRPTEYLFLIDLNAQDDHYAHFMGDLARALKDEGVFADIYYYTEDPRICFKQPGESHEFLADIQSRYINHRLVLVGDGDALAHPATGRLDRWTEIFLKWRDRTLLSTRRPRRWGMREVMLASEFIVLPATLNGLGAMTAFFESPERPDLRDWAGRDDSRSAAAEDADTLLKTLDDDTREWLCACAVYPELNFSLTLHLGMLLHGGVAEESLLSLVRLPWFRNGAIPEEDRMKLIQALNPKKLALIREAVYDVLKMNPPEADDPARPVYELNLAVHKLMISKKKRPYLKKIRDAEDVIVRDYTLLKVIESASVSPLNIDLPKWLQNMLFRKGVALFGVRPVVVLLMAFLVSFAALKWIPEPPEAVERPMESSIKLKFAYIPPGTFMMGSPEDEPGRYKDEVLHEVTLTKGFYMQKTEVTQSQWETVMGTNPSRFKDCGGDCPVEQVSWNDVQEFIKRLNQNDKSGIFRLPTEAEWERACRAGTATAFANGKITELQCGKDMNLDQIGWYCGNSGVNYKGCYDASGWGGNECAGPHPAAQKNPNAWGLYDMHGNVWEWCRDQCDWDDEKGVITETYVDGVVDPMNNVGPFRVVRGGSWFYNARVCRSALRNGDGPGGRNDNLGFRLARPFR